jgi:hypothetical protein
MTKSLNLTYLNASFFIDQPPYASSVILELRKSKSNNYYVQAYLKNNTANEPINPTLFSILGKNFLSLSIFKENLFS